MKIAIVAPSHVPFTVGGAEYLWWGMIQHINEQTEHMAELIKLPSPENHFFNLIESYKTFSNLDLSHFDAIISTKYPAWMVYHPNHICYIQHKLRGLYDAYHLTGLPVEFSSQDTAVNSLLDFMNRSDASREQLPEFFDRISDIYTLYDKKGPLFDFPGPFIRSIVHYLDRIALSSVSRFAAISKNVRNRTDYFPDNASVDIIYHPPYFSGFQCNAGSYLFTASRLDTAKRIGFLIDSMHHVKTNIPLIIAGTGPDAEALKEKAANDPRIRFIGFVNNDELLNYYANALAVVYVPYDEDYGLITIEAMMSGKPVITVTDSGGPNEFIIEGENGFSVAFDPQMFAEKIDVLASDPALAASMGNNARKTVSMINWHSTIDRLLSRKNRKKVTVLSTFTVYPPKGGGQNRIYHLYKKLSKFFDIDLIALSDEINAPVSVNQLAPGFKQISVPKSSRHADEEYQTYESKVNVPVTDVVFSQTYPLTPEFTRCVIESLTVSDIVIFSHPYTFYAAQAHIPKGCKIIYEAHNVEYDLKKDILPATNLGKQLLYNVKSIEADCCNQSDLVISCSTDVSHRLAELYEIPLDKFETVPNGVDLDSVHFTALDERLDTKKKLNMGQGPIVFFMGSWHGPNLSAMQFIIELAEKLTHISFLFAGSGCDFFKDHPVPDNVFMLGLVTDAEKDVLLSFVDAALNPMTEGSGTNMKVLDYLAAGVPVLSTPFGTRGLGLIPEKHLHVSELEAFHETLIKLLNQNENTTKQIISDGYKQVKQHFDWMVISEKLSNIINKLI